MVITKLYIQSLLFQLKPTMSTRSKQMVYFVGGAVVLGVLWLWYTKPIKEEAIKPKPNKKPNNNRATHFLSIRIDNPSIVGLAKSLQVK